MHEYDLIADWYATERKGPGGVPELESLIASLLMAHPSWMLAAETESR